MMRLRRAPVIVALCVLASAATAYAECGWVLWVTTANRSASSTDAWDSYGSLCGMQGSAVRRFDEEAA